MDVYDRATQAVLPEEQYEMFTIYIKRAAELFGVTHTRKIYEKAIEVLPNEQTREVCLRFADMERKLGEIDRARAIYSHCSQICDPRSTATFWDTWKEFEIKHGNEDTVREMLRIKRSVQALFNTQVNFLAAQMMTAQAARESASQEPMDEMKQLEQRARLLAEESLKDQANKAPEKGILFVRSSTTAEELGEMTKTNNPEEIQLDSDVDTDEEKEAEEVEVVQKKVPTQVFGSLVPDDDDN